MSGKGKIKRLKPRAPKGLRDIEADEVRGLNRMLGTIGEVYELYGFEPLDTPAFEYSDALGKFLPDQDRPNEGVFSFADDDDQWLSLRYDLTAPLARFVAENYDRLPKPFRRYQTGAVWRNEKPGPGRFRQFTQFDADSVGTAAVAADAELCMMAADCLERLGIDRGDYIMRVNDRRLLDAVLEAVGVTPGADHNRYLTILRAIDKLDRLGPDGVRLLLGPGRKDASGDFTKGADLAGSEIEKIIDFTQAGSGSRLDTLANLSGHIENGGTGAGAIKALSEMNALFDAAGFDTTRIAFDPSVVRGLGYYTGPVFEAELTFEAETEDGGTSRFGSVGGGGRYDGLIARFRSEPVPATGFSIGVSRLYAALEHLGRISEETRAAPVIVLVMDRDRIVDYQRMTQTLRAAGIRAEMYMGTSGMKAQMKYADRRNAAVAVIQGSDERDRDEVTLKDLFEGARMSAEITDNAEWRESKRVQVSVPESGLVDAVRNMLDRGRD